MEIRLYTVSIWSPHSKEEVCTVGGDGPRRHHRGEHRVPLFVGPGEEQKR